VGCELCTEEAGREDIENNFPKLPTKEFFQPRFGKFSLNLLSKSFFIQPSESSYVRKLERKASECDFVFPKLPTEEFFQPRFGKFSLNLLSQSFFIPTFRILLRQKT
jgi:hypothetical protein